MEGVHHRIFTLSPPPVALHLFFVGLVLFLHHLDTVILWFTSFLFTTLAPVALSRCPQKTPFIQGVIYSIRLSAYISAPVTDEQDIAGTGTKVLQLVFKSRFEAVHRA